MRCPVCGGEKCVCKGTDPQAGRVVDIPAIPERTRIMAGKLVKVQTGPSSYLKMTEKEAAEWRKTNQEFGGDNRVDLQEEQANQDSGAHDADTKPATRKAKA